MADEYLAMYLTVKFDLAGPTVFVPIRVFAETTLRLGQDIQNDAYFTTIDQAKDAMNRVSLHSPFQVCGFAGFLIARPQRDPEKKSRGSKYDEDAS